MKQTMKMKKAFLSAGAAVLTSGMLTACASAQPAPDTQSSAVTPEQSAKVQRHAEDSFSALDGREGSASESLDDVSASAEAARSEKAGEASAAGGTAEAPEETSAAEAVPETASAASEAAAAPAASDAAAEPSAEPVPDAAAADAAQAQEVQAGSAEAVPAPAASAQESACVLLPAPGRRASQSAADTLCRSARYDLGCPGGRIEISTLATGGPFHPWVFVTRGCEREATYHMVGDLIRLVSAAPDSTLPRADGRPPICAVEPYAGRQISRKAHGLICNEARSDLQCPDGDLRIIVLQIGRGPAPWHFAVEGCGYSVRYLMKGNTISRLQ